MRKADPRSLLSPLCHRSPCNSWECRAVLDLSTRICLEWFRGVCDLCRRMHCLWRPYSYWTNSYKVPDQTHFPVPFYLPCSISLASQRWDSWILEKCTHSKWANYGFIRQNNGPYRTWIPCCLCGIGRCLHSQTYCTGTFWPRSFCWGI